MALTPAFRLKELNEAISVLPDRYAADEVIRQHRYRHALAEGQTRHHRTRKWPHIVASPATL
jgi:hypothetical protein